MGADQSFLTPRPPLEQVVAQGVDIVISRPAPRDVSALVTIAIPTFRRPALLRESLESAVLQSTKRAFEIIVVDNDSTPEFARQVDAVVSTFDFAGLTLYRNRENLGMFGNWNRCLELTRTPWVSILNDDDLVRPQFVDTICRLIDTRPDLDLVQTGYDVWNRRIPGSGRDTRPQPTRRLEDCGQPRLLHWLDAVLANERAGSLGVAYRSTIAREIGGFDPSEYPTADYCFNVRLLSRARAALETDATLAIYRIEENESLKMETLQGFIRNDVLLRREAANYMAQPWLMRAYAQQVASAQRVSLERAWGTRIPSARLASEIGVKFSRGAVGNIAARVLASFLRRVLRSLR